MNSLCSLGPPLPLSQVRFVRARNRLHMSLLLSLGVVVGGLVLAYAFQSITKDQQTVDSELQALERCSGFNGSKAVPPKPTVTCVGPSAVHETCTSTRSSFSCESTVLAETSTGTSIFDDGDALWSIGVLGGWALLVGLAGWLTFSPRGPRNGGTVTGAPDPPSRL